MTHTHQRLTPTEDYSPVGVSVITLYMTHTRHTGTGDTLKILGISLNFFRGLVFAMRTQHITAGERDSRIMRHTLTRLVIITCAII